MRIGRTLPPAATPIKFSALGSGVCAIFRGKRELDRFKMELKEHFEMDHCFLVSSGKSAFTLILLALKELLPERNEVLIPAFTCYSVPSSVIRAGLQVRLCDQQSGSFDFDLNTLSTDLFRGRPLEDAGTHVTGAKRSLNGIGNVADCRGESIKKILAIVPTHLFGYPSDVATLRSLRKDPAVAIVEDAAQAMGETREGAKVGTLGDISFFSLARGKAFSVVEGGVILTNRDDVAEVLGRLVDRLPCYGVLAQMSLIFKAAALMLLTHPMLFWLPRSMPFLKLGETLFEADFSVLKMSSFQAGLARNWRRRLEMLRRIRKKNVDRWITLFAKKKDDSVCFPLSQSLSLLRFPLRVSDQKKRESLLSESARFGFGIMPVYPTPIDAIPELRGRLPEGRFPIAECYAKEIVTLPTHEYLTDDDATRIAELISRELG